MKVKYLIALDDVDKIEIVPGCAHETGRVIFWDNRGNDFVLYHNDEFAKQNLSELIVTVPDLSDD